MGKGNQVGRAGRGLVEGQSGFRRRCGRQVDLPQPRVGRSGARQDCLALERDVDIGWVEGDGASMVTELAHG
jgi:hypothetical protein